MDKPRQQPLVSVERQFETDVATGETHVRMFVKMYFEARESGLLADIGDHRWRTLCCLATYMNAEGRCCPSQARIANDLGISRQQVNRRLSDLAAYRFHGRPVLRIEKSRRRTERGERWANNVYYIHPISGLGIFDDARRRSPSPDPGEPVSAPCDTGPPPVSSAPESGNPDRNKSQFLNQSHTNTRVEQDGVSADAADSLVRRFHKARDHAPSRVPTPRELDQARELIESHGAEAADFVVDFALHQAQQTRFQMKTFGAVLQYVPEALVARRRQGRSRRQAVRHSDSDRFLDWRRERVDAARTAMEPARLRELEEAVRADLLEESRGSDDLGFELLVRTRVDALIASRLDLSRDAFRKQRDAHGESPDVRREAS